MDTFIRFCKSDLASKIVHHESTIPYKDVGCAFFIVQGLRSVKKNDTVFNHPHVMSVHNATTATRESPLRQRDGHQRLRERRD
ncbi:MAG TPA: hypothetical protein DCE42_30365 [Myxococcales bacterium]|nr:hypothetical protein [Deltaproteobacteria bacterium]MBU54807.1 hypothetical protein [Deltaproteobacteria bacterium]HAA59098.1 hypothetical protein [Myxococcales bacterium]